MPDNKGFKLQLLVTQTLQTFEKVIQQRNYNKCTCGITQMMSFTPFSRSVFQTTLGGDKVSMLSHMYPHKPLGKIKATICNHQADRQPFVWPDV